MIIQALDPSNFIHHQSCLKIIQPISSVTKYPITLNHPSKKIINVKSTFYLSYFESVNSTSFSLFRIFQFRLRLGEEVFSKKNKIKKITLKRILLGRKFCYATIIYSTLFIDIFKGTFTGTLFILLKTLGDFFHTLI